MTDGAIHTKSRRSRKSLWVIPIFFLVVASIWFVGGRVFRAIDAGEHDRILAAIDSAERVLIVPCEHEVVTDPESGPTLELMYDETRARDVTSIKHLRSILELTPYLSVVQASHGRIRCFYPHYVIRFIDGDSSMRELLLCFDCDNMRLDDRSHPYPGVRGVQRMPARWRDRLSDLIEAHGFTEHLD